MYYKWRQGIEVWLPFLFLHVKMQLVFILYSCLCGAEWGSRLWVLCRITTHVKLSLQTGWPSYSADEVLGRWEGCCVASCLRRGEIAQQAPWGAAGLAASCTHCLWTSRCAWPKSPSPLSLPGQPAERESLSGNLPCPWPSHSAKAPWGLSADLQTRAVPAMGFFMQAQATVLHEHQKGSLWLFWEL